MKNLNALAVSISTLGALATFLALGPLSGVYLIWVAFIAWGAFYAFGADTAALQKLVTCGIFGAFVAWVVAVLILAIPLAGALGTIPATVFGFAASFGYLLQTPEVLKLEVLLSPSLKNSLVVISLSLVVGGIFGLLSARWGAAMTEK
jgi:hypothetical protein